MEINFRWESCCDKKLINIYVGRVFLGRIIINEHKFVCLFDMLSLRFVICKTLNEAEIYIESKLTNWINDMMEGVKK